MNKKRKLFGHLTCNIVLYVSSKHFSKQTKSDQKQDFSAMAGSWMIKGFGSQHQVFISYQRPEIDHYFYDRLELDLQFNNINFCSDRDVDREGPEGILKRKIEESKIAIVIFSEKCTESTWWSKQLIMIADRLQKRQLVAIPIFYKLEPITISRLKGNTPYDFPRSDLEIAVRLISNKNGIIVDHIRHQFEKYHKLYYVRMIMGSVKRELKQQHYYKDLGEKLVAIIGCLLFLYFSLLIFTITPFSDVGGGAIVEDVPPEGTKITIAKDSDHFLTGKHGAKPVRSSSDAKTNIDVLDSKIILPQIQVFINFRGVQLRNNFVGHLVHALQKREVNVFIDNYEQRGEDLNTLFKRIEDSGIAIAVFSSRYTESKWCLDELVKIKERVHQGLLKVIPIFYKVSPTDVKKLKGEFGDHFRDQEHRYGYDSPLIKGWKEAIMFVTHKHALVYDEKSGALEIDFVERIVKEVLEMLQSISPVESDQSSN